jgi:hypothetical protein
VRICCLVFWPVFGLLIADFSPNRIPERYVIEEQFVQSTALKEPNFRIARQPPTMRGASDIDRW